MSDVSRHPVIGPAVSAGSATVAPKQPPAVTVQSAKAPPRSNLLRWFVNDIPYLVMLALALTGVVLRLSVSYWLIITPVFAVISIFEGWRNFNDKAEKLGFVLRLVLDWAALLLAIYFLFNGGVQGVMNANATSLAMMTLLALGTFVSGVQARVWQICAVGLVLFLAVPGLGWLDQSPLLLLAGAIAIGVLGSLLWWFSQRRFDEKTIRGAARPPR